MSECPLNAATRDLFLEHASDVECVSYNLQWMQMAAFPIVGHHQSEALARLLAPSKHSGEERNSAKSHLSQIPSDCLSLLILSEFAVCSSLR